MNRIAALVIALQSAVIAGLLWLQFRPPPEPAPRPAEAVAPVPEPLPTPPRRPEPPDDDPRGIPAGPQPLESQAERRAREYREERSQQAADAERKQFGALLDAARALLASGGLDALLWESYPHWQNGEGNDEDLRRLVSEFATETDPARLWALAQRIRFHMTDPRGSIWIVDEEAVKGFMKWASEAEDPVKRQIALSAVGATGWGRDQFKRDRFLNDPDARVQATAGAMLGLPRGVSEKDAAPLADRFRELLRSPDERVRAAAATGFSGWAFREEDVDALIAAAKTDTSMRVRENSLYGLGMSGSERARRTLKEIVADATYPESFRSRAATELARTGVVPDGAPLHEVE
jgi:hypothetical protein